MKSFVFILFFSLLPGVYLVCPAGLFGDDCNGVCGQCFNFTECDPITGECKLGCFDGYEPPLCHPKCEQDCSPGECVLPNYCSLCSDINLISPNCTDIRIRGLIGAGVSCAIMFTSIIICGLITEIRTSIVNPE